MAKETTTETDGNSGRCLLLGKSRERMVVPPYALMTPYLHLPGSFI